MTKGNKRLGLSIVDSGVQKQRAKQTKLPSLQLDLSTLVRDESGPLTEVGMRQLKFAKFKNECSQVYQNLFISSDALARDPHTLRQHRISHILNAVGYDSPNPFQNDLKYLTLFLYDKPQEDLQCVLYDCFDFFENALQNDRRVLVHCMQGVSRSAAIVIGYLMWKLDRKYQAVFDDVKNVRGIVNPNVGFISQLMLMQKRWKMGVKEGGCRVWRMGPHSPSDPTRIVPRPFVPEKDSFSFQSLDSRFVYVFQCERSTYVWKGQTASQEFIEGGLKFAEQLLRYERASDEIVQVEQGTEPRELIETCRDSQNSFDTVGVYTSSQTYDREKELEWFTQFKQIKKEGGREVGGVFSPRF